MAPEMGGSTEMGCRTEATDEAIFFKVSASVSIELLVQRMRDSSWEWSYSENVAGTRKMINGNYSREGESGLTLCHNRRKLVVGIYERHSFW